MTTTTEKPILRADTWRTNAELIADAVVPLGYIQPHDCVLDPTFGKGVWWKKYTPTYLTKHDIKLDGVDFRNLPHQKGSFSVVAFDPPYVAKGGRETSTITDFDSGFGLKDAPRTPGELHHMIVEGLAEIHRVLQTNGLVLLKCMNYVTSGHYYPAAYDLLAAATDHPNAPFKLVDEFIHLGKPGPQPPRTKQYHTRANYSHLFVLEKVA